MRRFAVRPVLLGVAVALVLTACTGEGVPPTTALGATVPLGQTTTTSAAPGTTAVATTTSPTTTTLPAGPPLIQEGDRNEMVEAFQHILNCTGHGELDVDGAFGPATLAAVEAAQTALGRTVNGAPDDDTFAELSRQCGESRRLFGDEGVVTVVGNAAPGDPETFAVSLLADSVLTITITLGIGPLVIVRRPDGSELVGDTATSWTIDGTGDYTVEVVSNGGPVTFAIAVNVTEAVRETGDWILATDGITYRGTELAIGDDASSVIDDVFDFLGHGIRGAYLEFDTDWYVITDPQEVGIRGVFIEGLAFLFFGPSPADPARPETLVRIRFEGPSDDADGDPRPDDYVTTAEGITVGNALADLQAAYGDDVDAGSNSEEHYYRYADSGGELCFYFGPDAPSATDEILEIATECRD